jgi:hypothetical protein
VSETQIDPMDELRKQNHDLRNDLCAYTMLVYGIMRRIGVDKPENLIEALDERLARAAHIGRQAVILVDDQDCKDLLELTADQDAKDKAKKLVESGEIATAIVATLHGRYVMPQSQPEWIAQC